MTGQAQILFEDLTSSRQRRFSLSSLGANEELSLDSAFAIISPVPTYKYSVALRLAPGSRVETLGLVLRTDFQFARLALLKLDERANEIDVHMPLSAGADPTALRLGTVPRLVDRVEHPAIWVQGQEGHWPARRQPVLPAATGGRRSRTARVRATGLRRSRSHSNG